ncbi:unnamed protein product [Nippostrongylus brasiliensis]|uniref:Glycogen [starch] synthase n=1 Tax=Nippostrongylus brasiliensis TaxID=27835 RepID=A0A0N4XVF1_NIPBR|nr:unnamed protein product [Nippostrongylus brasiliensis]
MGVPSVATSLSGFGCFINQHVGNAKSYGIHVVDRNFKGCYDHINKFTEICYEYPCLSRRQRIIVRNSTERLSELLYWKILATERLAAASSVPATPSISCPTTPHESDYSENSELDDREEMRWHEN